MSDKPDVAALIAELLDEAEWYAGAGTTKCADAETARILRQAAAALQSQQERIAELERALRIFDPGLNSLDANKVPPLQINEQSR